MPKKIYRFLILFSIIILAVPQALAVLPAQVNYDGERISVHAEGVSLGQLLSLVEKQTGVQFSLNSLAAETIVHADFTNSALSDGIKRILSKCNHAILYDGSGRICTVFVFNRQQVLGKRSNNQSAQYYAHKESEAFSQQSPDEGPEGRRPPPWAAETLSPQSFPRHSGSKPPFSPADSIAGENSSPQNDDQLQSPSTDSDAEDISPQSPSMDSDAEDISPQSPSMDSDAEGISPQSPSMDSDEEGISPQSPSMDSDAEDISPSES